MAKDTYVFTHVGHKFISNHAIWNKYASMGSFFFQKHCANPYGACKCREIGECLFLLRGTRNQLKRFLAVCNFVFSISISALLEFN